MYVFTYWQYKVDGYLGTYLPREGYVIESVLVDFLGCEGT